MRAKKKTEENSIFNGFSYGNKRGSFNANNKQPKVLEKRKTKCIIVLKARGRRQIILRDKTIDMIKRGKRMTKTQPHPGFVVFTKFFIWSTDFALNINKKKKFP